MASRIRCVFPALFVGTSSLSLAFSGSSFYVSCHGQDSSFKRPTFEACPEVACASSEELSSLFGDRVYSRRRNMANVSSSSENSSTSNSIPSVEIKGNIDGNPVIKNTLLECPPMREELGYHSWNLLHSIAAYYPVSPSEVDIHAARGLIIAIAQLYPCLHCREAFQRDIELYPPQLNSREEFSLWVCKQHNLVNEMLGKKEFPCSLPRLDERWRTGKPECWGNSPISQNAEESLGQSID